ncbi:MAG: hypothetical protein PHS62_01070 [Patescibacteria group bacterium]|nr:hypothetical protein [Patescibacteria group bacterium]
MTLRTRRILSSIFILFFIIIAPAIILYAAGYKFGKKGFSMERTGMFIVESKPRGAKIFLDGKAQRTWLDSILAGDHYVTTPAEIKNLLPGEYDLSLELDGYFSWHEKLSINPGASTLAKGIYLLKNSLPIQVAPAVIQAIGFSPDRNQALIITEGKITVFHLSSETKKSGEQKGLAGKNISWSPDSRKFLVDNYLYSADNLDSKIDLNKLTAGAFNGKWDNNVLFYQDKTSVYRLDSNNRPEKIAGNLESSDYLVKGGFLYLISRSKQAALLKVIDLSSNQLIKSIDLPGSTDYSFINPAQSLINIYDSGHKILYLVDPAAARYSPIVEIINDVNTAFWYKDDSLLYTNDFEIWLYDLASKNKTLITRISEKINNAIMHPYKNYIIYSNNQAISAIELNDSERKNVFELIKFDSIGPLAFDSAGEIIFFSGRVGNQQGLYKLSIQ